MFYVHTYIHTICFLCLRCVRVENVQRSNKFAKIKDSIFVGIKQVKHLQENSQNEKQS